MRRPALRRSPGSRLRSVCAWLSLAAVSWLLCAPGAWADTPKIYKWVDSHGIAHYTTDPKRIPKALRERIQSVERSHAAPEATTVEPLPSPTPEAATVAPAPAPRTPTATTTPATPAPTPATSTVPPTPAPTPETSTLTAAPTQPAVSPPPTHQATVAPAPAQAPEAAATVPAPPNSVVAPEVAPSIPSATAAPTDVSNVHANDAWFERDALPHPPDAATLASGKATPAQLAALAAQQKALDAQIAEVQAAITKDETFLKGLISDPKLEEDVPLFDRPEFLEVSKRLPQLQAKLEELRDERAKLEIP